MEIWFYCLLTILILLITYYLHNLQFSTRRMPPGPLNIPILGSALGVFSFRPIKSFKEIISPKTWEYFHLASKKYGGVFSSGCGSFTGVVFTDYEMLREIENLDEYSIKVSNEMTMIRSHNKELGLIFVATPEIWMEMRKFSQRTLRDFGFGKRHSMQSVIEAEITELVKEIQVEIAKTNGILKIRTNFILSVLNILWCMIAGQRYAHDDPKLNKMLTRNFAMTKTQTFVDPVILAFPFLRNWFPSIFGWKETLQTFRDSHEYSQSLIDERREEGVFRSEPQNYIDCFLKKIEEHKNNPNEKVYTDENLQIMIEDFMQTGSTTSVGTLNYGVLFLTLNPQVQERCQKEIDAIVPRNLVPTMDDVEKMPYFQATILETHRLACVVPIPIPRIAPHDWHYRDWIIPKDTIILSNHYSVLMDEEYWKDPEIFRPSRFLDEQGQFVPDKRVIHFGMGKRYCIGVTLSNSVIPIFIATLLQNFNFSVLAGETPPSREPEVGVSLSPKEFRCRVVPRP